MSLCPSPISNPNRNPIESLCWYGSKSKPRGMFLWILVVALVYLCIRSVNLFWGRRCLLRARRLHHATPPLARSAEREYERASRRGYAQALIPRAMLLEHGLPEGPEPLPPNPTVATDIYLQAALLGDAREQGFARERLAQLAPGVPVVARPQPAMRRVPVLEPVRHTPSGPVAVVKSDSQNVHDSCLVRHIKASLDKLPDPPQGQLVLLRQFLQTGSDEDKRRSNALRVIDSMETNTVELHGIHTTEANVLSKVWYATMVPGDEEETKLRRDMLVERLAEIAREKSCTSGRVARVVDALSVFDERVKLNPTWVLRREMLDKAAVLAQKTHDRPLKEVLLEHFIQDYVNTGLMPRYLVDAELKEWGDAI